MKNNIHKNVFFNGFTSRESLVKDLASDIALFLESRINKRGHASLIVSGGSTPILLFEALSKKNIKWKQVYICLADERWVEPSENDSNERLVRDHLLQNNAASASFVGLYSNAASAKGGVEECGRKVSLIPRPFDLLVLGMGNDGHTASLFPGARNLKKATDMESGKICLNMSSPNASHDRMTLTLPVLVDSRQVILHIIGSEKLAVFEKAIAGDDMEEMPIRFIFSRAVKPVQVYWAP
ncbi:MAG: 6-phosphogluconolactonase [Desulfobulbaceae bacterium]|nr:6-phosphogluconolactonase [Desulfobulbaceae bacterium]